MIMIHSLFFCGGKKTDYYNDFFLWLPDDLVLIYIFKR